MPAEVKKEIQLEIAHVLFMDIIGYSKLPITEQRASLEKLNQIVRDTDEYKTAEAAGRLIKIPTGDGMALVFYNNPEEPVDCALEISRAFKDVPQIGLRMGVHSGPVSGVVDVNERANVAGAGINIAQRVMDCGDAGHILLSKRVADDLEQYPHWRPHLHDLGECEVKHGVRVHIVNLYTNELGNPQPPNKFKAAAKKRNIKAVAGFIFIAGAGVAASLFLSHRLSSRSAAPAIPEKSIAVLPFTNMSANAENAFFADGVQDEILTNLAKIADLKVISRTSVMQYKDAAKQNVREIGQQLGVAHLVEGSVQRAANHIRVEAQLIDARTDAHQWAEHYDRDLADVFAIQSEIAKAIADQLQAKLSPAEKAAIEKPPTTDLPAYDLYARANSLLAAISFNSRAKDDMLQAVQLLDQAVARDPKFLLAYCQLAYAHGLLYFLGHDHTPARLALADAAVQTAVHSSPESGDAHLALAENLYRCHLDYTRALPELAIAHKTLPNDARVFALHGYIDRRQGRDEEGLHNLERALELDPRNLFMLHQIAFSYEALHRYREYAAALDRALVILPNDIDARVERASVDLKWRADTRPLHATVESVLAQNPGAAQTLADKWMDLALCERDASAADRALVALGQNNFGSEAVRLRKNFGVGLIARMTGDEAAAHSAFVAAREEQVKAVDAQPEYGPALCILGLIDAFLGRKEEALRESRRAIELLPPEKDSVNGPIMLEYSAIIAAWSGEKDLAIERLKLATRLPNRLHYGQLKLHPFWDPLRGDPRFEKIVASLAPKESL